MNYVQNEPTHAQRVAEHLSRELREGEPPSERKIFSLFGSDPARAKERRERDIERGYSINTKQVVLAFAVELLIIGLILVSQYFYATDFINSSQSKTVLALLFPVALAVVELARVPLAIAVRTQNKWNMQFAALLGVSCAIVVTSASLYQIGHYTFNPRLENVYLKRAALEKIQDGKRSYEKEREAAQATLEQRIKDWQTLSNTYRELSSKLNQQSGLSQNCITVETPPNPDGGSSSKKTTRCSVDPAFKALQAEVAAAKAKLSDAEAAGRQAEGELAKFDVRKFDEKINQAEEEYRDAIYHSQLHAYTGMLFGKDARDVSEGEVKTLEWYLILIPSIAAAFSSTLIAMTAVRRIKPAPVVTIPDEAAAYLFGPLVAAIQAEAKKAVASAIGENAKEQAQTEPKATSSA